MPFTDALVKKLTARFEPSSTQQFCFRGADVVAIIDKDGKAAQVFVGKAAADGTIRGDRYSRTLKYNPDGTVLKDHWERKGKAS